MKPTSTLKITCVMIVALGISGSPWSRGQQSSPASQPEPKPASQTGQSVDASGYSTNSAPKNIHKASKLIGVDVVNQNQQKLGKISDIVIDFQKARVAYAVLEVDGEGLGGLLNIGDKLIAVPLAAFVPSPDDERPRMTLNVDMKKFTEATGFNDDRWPSIDQPMWGAEPFWQTESSTENAGKESDSSAAESDSQNPTR